MSDRPAYPGRSRSGQKKTASHDWVRNAEDFKKRVLETLRPYFVIACACNCGRLNCQAAAGNRADAVIVLPVVNFSEFWETQWRVLH